MIHLITELNEVLDSVDRIHFFHHQIGLEFPEIHPEILNAFYEKFSTVDPSLGEIEMPCPLKELM